MALRVKGETVDELVGFARAMRRMAQPMNPPVPGEELLDTCGTGGDGAATVNISTAAAVVASACGVPVVKHGNRAASSKCGAADLLEALGVAIDLPPEGVLRCVTEVGIGFCFAPVFHPAMRYTAAARSGLGVPTAMNVLGPLTNPAQPAAGLVGCADARIAPVIADVLARRGTSALVVRGDDGLDEITTTTTTTVWVVSDGSVRQDSIDPSALGLWPATAEDLRGGDTSFNADVARALFDGRTGPVRDAVVLNAAAAVAAYDGPGPDLSSDVRVAMERVERALDSGAAADLLARWARCSTSLRA
jgi:anthranilate phosphoribosyltransferase